VSTTTFKSWSVKVFEPEKRAEVYFFSVLKMWSLIQDKKELKPLIFSNGKTQEDIVKEVIETAEQGYKIIFIRGMCGTGKCLDKYTLVFCKPGGEKYFSYHRISNLEGKEGRAFSVNNQGDLVESNFKNVRKTGIKKLYKLKTRTGREIMASVNHPFLTITEKGIEWKPLKELSSESYICLPNQIEIKDKYDFDDNKIKVLAHLIAEGKLGDKAGSPVYFQDPVKNPEIRKDYINSLKSLFPEGELKSYSKKDVVITFNNMDTRFGTTNKLRLFIREQGLDGKKSSEKFIPKIIFNLEKEKVALFLNRLFSCDGTIYSKKSGNKQDQIIIEYTSISDRLIRDISILLLRFGIQHTITSKKFRKDLEYSKRITISNHKSIRRFIKQIGFIGRKQKLAEELYLKTKNHKFTNIDKVPRIIREYLKNKGYGYNQLDRFLNYEEIESFRKNIGFKKIRLDKSIKTPYVFAQGKIDFLREHLRNINKYIDDPTISFICNKNIIWDKIKSIDFIKEDETYDLEVEEHYNFIANGIITHNSAIALNLARYFGKTSVVVPIKSLQEQYTKDYTQKLEVLDKQKIKPLKISSIFGRKNFQCKFLEENQDSNENLKTSTIKETNAKLFDVYQGTRTSHSPKEKDLSADNIHLPCKIEIKEKNSQIIKNYIKQNPLIKKSDFHSINEVKRMSIAPVCPYWSPIIPSEIDITFKNSEKITYKGLNNIEFTIYQRERGCKYYEQYLEYKNSDVLIFNSLKYKLETLMNRKPQTELEIIDECDEFLDSFANIEKININRLLFSLNMVFSENERNQKIINELIDLTNSIKKKYHPSNEIYPVSETPIKELLLTALRNRDFINEIEIDESSYLFHLDEVARIFYDFLDETFFSIEKQDNDVFINLVTTNLEKRFKELVEKNKVLVMMSGTIHSEKVLKNIFGLDKFKIIDAEIQHQGELINCKHGYELNCSFNSFQNNTTSRENYLKTFSKTISCSKPPVLVHLTSFSDLPSEHEKETYSLDNLPTQQELVRDQNLDPLGKRIKDFKNKKFPILFTTKCSRGIDFPGDTCNSIVISRFPYPNISSIFWKILKKTNPEYFMEFYLDKSYRELMQKIYRGLRSKSDKVYLLSPDSRVVDFEI